MLDEGPGPEDLPHLLPPEVRERIPVTRIEDEEEVPADTAHAAIAWPHGIHLIALAYDYPDVPHLYFALTVSTEEPGGEWGDIDLWQLHTSGVALSAMSDWQPTPMSAAKAWAMHEMGGA